MMGTRRAEVNLMLVRYRAEGRSMKLAAVLAFAVAAAALFGTAAAALNDNPSSIARYFTQA
jgi:hypothetical protein